MKCKALGPLAVLALHVLSTPLGVAAQEPAKMPRIGVLEGGDPSTSESLDKVFQDKLRRLGYVEGQNIAIERRWAGRRLDRLPALAAELVRLQVAVIVAAEEPVIRAAKQTTSTIPIVMSSVEDPVGAGFVTSLEVRSNAEFEGVFAAIARARAEALALLPDPLLYAQHERLVALAAKDRLPTIYASREPVEAGGLMSYGPSPRDNRQRAAVYVDRILKGAKPANLSIQPPTKFELVINLRTASAVGLSIPKSVRDRADRMFR